MPLSIFSRVVAGSSVVGKDLRIDMALSIFSRVVAGPSVDVKGFKDRHATQYIFTHCGPAFCG